MRLTVLHGGLLTTIQDQGRPGYFHLGIPTSGALAKDDLAFFNRLLGNDPSAAGLEFTLSGPKFRAEGDVYFALWGADKAVIDGRPVAEGEVTWLPPKAELTVGPLRRKQSVMAVAGGLNVPEIMGSRSTFLAGSLGHPGRALRAGDLLVMGTPAPDASSRVGFSAKLDERIDRPLRVVVGPDEEAFGSDAVAAFLAGSFVVGPVLDRMGARLQGERIPSRVSSVPSRPVVPGIIQIPPEGHPLLMLADHQTTGGYPRIATVISADLTRAGRLAAGDTVEFEAVSPTEARRIRADEAAARDTLLKEASVFTRWAMTVDGSPFAIGIREI